MTRLRRPPLRDAPKGVRQRRRADGSWRVWWEPTPEARARGFAAEEISADRIGMRRAQQLAAMAEAAAGAAAAGAGRVLRGDRTVRALIADYLRDPHFLGLRPATQADYRKAFVAIDRDWGDRLVATVAKADVRAWRADLLACRRPWQRAAGAGETRAWQARAMTVKLSVLLAHAEIEGWIPEGSNPALRLDGRRKQPLGAMAPRARVASWDELGALLRAARELGDVSMAVAIALAALTAQRQADIVGATLDAFRHDGVWSLIRSKRGNLGRIALHPVAHGAVREWLARRPPGGEALLLCERTGKPYSADLFRKVWGAARRKAAETHPGVETLQFRDLRRTFGHLARLGGADKGDVAATLGNRSDRDAALEITYMPTSDQVAARAVAAIEAPASILTALEWESEE